MERRRVVIHQQVRMEVTILWDINFTVPSWGVQRLFTDPLGTITTIERGVISRSAGASVRWIYEECS